VTGLYAGILSAVAYAALGSSAVQSVGPMAITSLMTASALTPLAAAGSAVYAALAAQLALLAGLVLLCCGLLRLGALAHFLSRPVLSGFTSGAALLIAWSQLRTLLGGDPAAPHPWSAALGLGTLALLWLARARLGRLLGRLGVTPTRGALLANLVPAALLGLATALVYLLPRSAAGVALVGAIPAGLPPLGLVLDPGALRSLAMPALMLGFIVFLTGQSAAVSLAQRRGERVDGNRELLGLGAANIASALSGGFVVSGSLSRTAINHAAGARTPLSTLITAAGLALLLVAAPDWLALLPLPVLAAIIIASVLGMLDLHTPREAWRYDRQDALAWGVTLAGVLLLGIEAGVTLGILLSLGSVIARASRPLLVRIGRLPDSHYFRNVERAYVRELPRVLFLRVDAGLFYGNAEPICDQVLARLEPGTRDLVLVLSAVNLIDTTGLYALADLNRRLQERDVRLHLAEVKGRLMDRLRRSPLLLPALGGEVFPDAARAFDTLAARAVS